MNKVFVGNLPYTVTDSELGQVFSQYGKVSESIVIMDRTTGRSKGFGFVTFESVDDAKKATTALNGKDYQGRNMVVSEARPRV